MANNELAIAVERFTNIANRMPDKQLERAWAWQSYDSEGIRFAFFRTYEELRELAVNLQSERVKQAKPISSAQNILAQYHAAYWDLQAALLGVENRQLDQAPAKDEWPVRKVLAHIISADLGFYVVVRYALDRHRSGDGQPAELSEETWTAISGMDENSFNSIMTGPFEALRDYHNTLHERILHEFSDISDAELDVLSRYWEKELMSLRFRLHRFDSHLRQHTIQIDKTRVALGQFPSEAQRLARLIYAALANASGTIIGAWETGESRKFTLAKTISTRAEEIASRIA